MAVLQQKTGDPPLATIPLSGLSLRIGRRSSCEIFVDSRGGLLNRTVARDRRPLGDQIVSELHAVINGGVLQNEIVLLNIHRTQEERHDSILSRLRCEGDET